MSSPMKKAGIRATVGSPTTGLPEIRHGVQYKAVPWTPLQTRVSCVMSTATTAVQWACGTDTAETDFS